MAKGIIVRLTDEQHRDLKVALASSLSRWQSVATAFVEAIIANHKGMIDKKLAPLIKKMLEDSHE